MRILVVSAHFPPNFVSGGTLAPQRLARGLRARGHDVSVYAGHLDEGRPPLTTWDETDDTGLPVRWVATTPWTGWSDRHNFDNPEVARDFARHLERVRPDVVHFHSVQTLGAGLLPVAAGAGARVVVTMHDFWWYCSRQFLVDREYRPCSIVVDCGVCPCEVDRPWLDERNRFLAGCLASADLVLAPSASAARVFAANGAPEDRLRVDENGLPEADRAVPPRPASPDPATVRFRYAGGWNQMKGSHVVTEAAVRLGSSHGAAGWRLFAHDLGPYLETSGVALDGLPVDVVAPFGPAETDAVFAATDVLLVPSVMRESHSLVTREALTRGVPVICTDTLGPEEVVVHGRNGLVVPAGDAAALAAAMASVVDDRRLLDDLRDGAAAPVRVRPLAEQVLDLEAVYTELTSTSSTTAHKTEVGSDDRPAASTTAHKTEVGSDDRPAASTTAHKAEVGSDDRPGASAGRRKIRRVLFLVGITGAPLRYRARLPAEALALHGVHADVRYYRDLDVDALARAADAVVVYRVPATVQVLDLIARVRAGGTPVLFDVDDLIFDPDLAAEIPALSILAPADAELWLEGVRRYRTTMEACDAFVGSTDALCRHARAVTDLPAFRFDNGVGVVLAQRSDAAARRPRRPGPPRIAYLSGTDTHDHDWAMVEPAVERVLREHVDAELWLVGMVRPSPALDDFGRRLTRVPFTAWTELPDLLRDIDVNLAPLTPGSRFNEAKSAIKWLEAALVGTPTVASPTGPFRDAIENGVNGSLAATVDEWAAAVGALLADPHARTRLGQRARRDALLRWSPHLQGRRYLDILERVEPQPARRSSWVPVAHDEPAVASPLDPYDAPVATGGGRRVPVAARLLYRRLRAVAARAVQAWRRHGAVGTARIAAARVSRRLRGRGST